MHDVRLRVARRLAGARLRRPVLAERLRRRAARARHNTRHSRRLRRASIAPARLIRPALLPRGLAAGDSAQPLLVPLLSPLDAPPAVLLLFNGVRPDDRRRLHRRIGRHRALDALCRPDHRDRLRRALPFRLDLGAHDLLRQLRAPAVLQLARRHERPDDPRHLNGRGALHRPRGRGIQSAAILRLVPRDHRHGLLLGVPNLLGRLSGARRHRRVQPPIHLQMPRLAVPNQRRRAERAGQADHPQLLLRGPVHQLPLLAAHMGTAAYAHSLQEQGIERDDRPTQLESCAAADRTPHSLRVHAGLSRPRARRQALARAVWRLVVSQIAKDGCIHLL